MSYTKKQRSSLHIAMRRYVKLLNESGFDIQKCILENLVHLPVDWTEQNFKNTIGRAYLTTMYPDKTSFEQLDTKEAQRLFENMNRGMSETFGISIEFPSYENKDNV